LTAGHQTLATAHGGYSGTGLPGVGRPVQTKRKKTILGENHIKNFQQEHPPRFNILAFWQKESEKKVSLVKLPVKKPCPYILYALCLQKTNFLLCHEI
jgi:hypothetical protein